jgi:quinol monooxygenase YgiN
MIHVVAHIEVVPGQREEFLEEFRRIVPLVRAEVGCIAYGPTVDAVTELPNQKRDPNRVVVVEQWDDLPALQAHMVAPHMQSYRERVRGLVAQVALFVLDPA